MGTVWLSEFSNAKKTDISALTTGARFLLMLYCDCANNETGITYPGTPYLMRMTGYGERQVQRYVQELRSAGFIQLVRNRGGRRMYATYRVQLSKSNVPQEAREELERLGIAPDVEGEGAHEDGDGAPPA